MTKHMTIELSDAQAAHLEAEAQRQSITAEALVAELVQRQVDYDTWFRAEVQKGVDAADRGEFLAHEEVVERSHRRRDELLGRKRTA